MVCVSGEIAHARGKAGTSRAHIHAVWSLIALIGQTSLNMCVCLCVRLHDSSHKVAIAIEYKQSVI